MDSSPINTMPRRLQASKDNDSCLQLLGIGIPSNDYLRQDFHHQHDVPPSLIPLSDSDSDSSFDSNLTTLFAALFLYIFGSGPIKGFAVTLAIGIVTSLFTAVMVTRLLIILWVERKRPSKIIL